MVFAFTGAALIICWIKEDLKRTRYSEYELAKIQKLNDSDMTDHYVSKPISDEFDLKIKFEKELYTTS